MDYMFLYRYHRLNGLSNFILRHVFNILISVFITAVVITVYSIDWSEIINCKPDSKCQFLLNTNQSVWLKTIVIINILAICIYTLWNIAYMFYAVPRAYTIRTYIRDTLNICDYEFSLISWETLIQRVALHEGSNYQQLLNHANNKVMEYDNNLIRIAHYGQISWGIIPWTFVTEWILITFIITRAIPRNVTRLKRYFRIYGVLSVFLVVFFILAVTITVIIRESERYHAKKMDVGSKSWTIYSKRLFQQRSEVKHKLEQRLNKASIHANKIQNELTNQVQISVARFISFITGGMMTIITIWSIINDDVLLYMNIFGRNLLSYMGIFTLIFAAARVFLNDHISYGNDIRENIIELQKITDHPNFNSSDIYLTKRTLDKYYVNSIKIVVLEIYSFILLPYYMGCLLPNNLQEIVNIIESNTLLEPTEDCIL